MWDAVVGADLAHFNSAAYLAANPDLQAGGFTPSMAREHYRTSGMAEGRQPYWLPDPPAFGDWLQNVAQVQGAGPGAGYNDGYYVYSGGLNVTPEDAQYKYDLGSVDQAYVDMYTPDAQGNLIYGSRGVPLPTWFSRGDLLTDKVLGSAIQKDGKTYFRVGNSVPIAGAGWNQGQKDAFAAQGLNPDAVTYDPEYGYLMPQEAWSAAATGNIQEKGPESFWDGGLPIAFGSLVTGGILGPALAGATGLTTGAATGIIGGGLKSAVSGGSLLDIAKGALLGGVGGYVGGEAMSALKDYVSTNFPGLTPDDYSKVAGYFEDLSNDTPLTLDDAGNVIEGDVSIPADTANPLPGPSTTPEPGVTTPDASSADMLKSIQASADPIEAMYKSTALTGTETVSEAAKALGYNGAYEMLNAVNPSWLSTTGSTAALLQKLGLTSAAGALTSGGSLSNLLGGVGLKDLLSAGAAIGSSIVGSNAAKDAAATQSQAAKEAAALQKYMFDTTRGDLMPWLNQGKVALGRVGELLGISGDANAAGYGSLMRNFNASDLAADPIYGAAKDFQIDEGRRMLTNAASARGETDSGVLMKDLMKYGTGVLTSEGANAFNRYNANRTLGYNFIAPTANLGQTTGIQLGNLGQTTAQGAGNFNTQAANAQAAGQIGSANAINGGISTALQSYMQNDLLRRFGVLAE